jgi:hypothetical protein
MQRAVLQMHDVDGLELQNIAELSTSGLDGEEPAAPRAPRLQQTLRRGPADIV